MFADFLIKYVSAEYNHKILLFDDYFEGKTHYSNSFLAIGFEVVYYNDDLNFRIGYEEKLKNSNKKILVIASAKNYVPYDILQQVKAYTLSYEKIFSKLNAAVLKNRKDLNLDLLCLAYSENYDNLLQPFQTENFLEEKVCSKANIEKYIKLLYEDITEKVRVAQRYNDWIVVAELKANIDVLAAKYRISIDLSEVNEKFKNFILTKFSSLSSEIDKNTPVLVSRAMDYMHDNSEKFAIIVMDGMSEFDWKILSQSFVDIHYEQTGIFAMIPTTTSISRQCLLSNKKPVQLLEPWKQSKERQEFIACAKELGYSDNQIGYERGYNATFNAFVKCAAVIINDIDDMVHAQYQGRQGMLNDVALLAEHNKLANLTKNLISTGFDVYITADHGNTPCIGLGKLMGTGLEIETKSRRMLVLNNLAAKDSLKEKYRLIEYPKYYLNKDYTYLICNTGDSFDAKDENVMSHGGITIDEVIVPFIKIKAVK